MREHARATPFESRGRTYYRVRMADTVDVIYRPLDPGEQGAGDRPTFAIYVLVASTERAS